MFAYGTAHEETQDANAFRLAEKKYQLHLQQEMRYRGGRMRGGKLVAQPTDLSDIIDIRNTASAVALADFHVHHLFPQTCSPRHCSRAQSCSNSCRCHGSSVKQAVSAEPAGTAALLSQQQTTCSRITALTFPQHPGLAVFPNALSALQQLQLMRAAMKHWPEPPTRTNHTKQYGSGLTGLFAAAQAGLLLVQQPTQQPGTQQHQQQQGEKHQQVAAELLGQPAALQQDTATAEAGAAAGLSSIMLNDSSCCCTTGSQQQQQAICPSAAPSAPVQLQHSSSCLCSSPSATPSHWSAEGKGPKAAVLLRKLRWASLGPPFNWTDRVYEHHVEHTPLPAELVSIGCQYAALAAEVSSSSSSADQTQNSADTGTGSTHAAADQQNSSQLSPPFNPDVALVNYYHAGDTLGGHKDDVEPNMTQPIVTMSLGCEAVFLIGGSSRDQQPTALLLRSGDVVVLGGPARSCYHGVPRIFTDQGLPEELAAVVEQRPEFGPYLEYFKQCRVNVSVRCIL